MEKNLGNPPVLGLSKLGGSYMVDTDASQYALRAVLLREQDFNGGTANGNKQ